jgi:hypothetical protein
MIKDKAAGRTICNIHLAGNNCIDRSKAKGSEKSHTHISSLRFYDTNLTHIVYKLINIEEKSNSVLGKFSQWLGLSN